MPGVYRDVTPLSTKSRKSYHFGKSSVGIQYRNPSKNVGIPATVGKVAFLHAKVGKVVSIPRDKLTSLQAALCKLCCGNVIIVVVMLSLLW